MVHYLAGRYPGKIGWMVGPSGLKKSKLRDWIPFALDNDAFSAWSQKKKWDESEWRKMVENISRSRRTPLWLVVPDVVCDKNATLESWDRHYAFVDSLGWDKAFAVQDGMVPGDVPEGADIIFVGGSTEWKWKTTGMWCKNFKRVHVGRVNSIEKLQYCEDLGVESVDGTGWFRDSEHNGKASKLRRWIEGERESVFDFFSLKTTK